MSWLQESFYKYTVGIILVLLIILLLYHTAPFFSPILWFATAILLPILFSTFFYYVLRPAVEFLETVGVPRYLAILSLYFALFLLATIVGFFVIPNIVGGLKDFGEISPERVQTLKTSTNIFISHLKSYLPISEWSTIENWFLGYLQDINTFIYKFIVNSVSTVAGIAIALALTPFVLFYFLRDASLMPKFLMRYIPSEFQEEGQRILLDIDKTLSAFILAQVTVALIVGCFLFCGYFLIGLPEAFALAIFAMFFYVIPILGTFIAVIPALIVATSVGIGMVVKVIVVMFVAHFLEANMLTPRLMSHTLKIHPLTIILLLLAAGSLYGLLGLLLVTPTYAILKVVVWNLYKISRLHYTMAKAKAAVKSPELP